MFHERMTQLEMNQCAAEHALYTAQQVEKGILRRINLQVIAYTNVLLRSLPHQTTRVHPK